MTETIGRLHSASKMLRKLVPGLKKCPCSKTCFVTGTGCIKTFNVDVHAGTIVYKN